jgi:hypothetical protein
MGAQECDDDRRVYQDQGVCCNDERWPDYFTFAQVILALLITREVICGFEKEARGDREGRSEAGESIGDWDGQTPAVREGVPKLISKNGIGREYSY